MPVSLKGEVEKNKKGFDMIDFIYGVTKRVKDGRHITTEEALQLFNVKSEIPFLLGCAAEIRRHFIGDEVKPCAIINARSGNCSEDCAFCSQSAHSKAKVDTFPLVEPVAIVEAAARARRVKAKCFGIVTSGKAIEKNREAEAIGEAVAQIKSEISGLEVSVSIGSISREVLRLLKRAGIDKVHHNLETAASFFPQICTTHSYEDKIRELQMIKEEGVSICRGGIIGLGEKNEQRVEMAMALRELKINSVPLNFLNPIPGTRLENNSLLSSMEALKIIAIYRFILPQAEIRVCGGREVNLRSLQPAVFWAGATGVMIGNYLTTKGQEAEADLKIIEDLELKIS